LLVIAFLVISMAAVPIAVQATNWPIEHVSASRFALRQKVGVTPFNGTEILRYLQVMRRFRWAGTTVGAALELVTIVDGTFTISPYYLVTGWLLGVVAGELAFGRRRGRRFRRPPGLSLAPPPLLIVWRISAAGACGIALCAVLRSFWFEVGVVERAGAVATFGVVLAVQALVGDLHRRALPEGPADLVGAELAMRSRSARSLLGAGSAVALWTAPLSGLPQLPLVVKLLGMAVIWGLPVLGWFQAGQPWQVAAVRWRRVLFWPGLSAVLVAGALTATWFAWGAERNDDAQAVTSPLTGPVAEPVSYAQVSKRTGTWELFLGPPGGTGTIKVDQADTRVPGSNRRAPFAISGDGRQIIYLDRTTHRLTLRSLFAASATRDLTGPLPLPSAPDVAFSQDGRAILTWADRVELIDVATGARTRLLTVRRVLGTGPDGVVATTGPRALVGAPDTELVTLDHAGEIRTRVPFDPTLRALLAPHDRLVIVKDDEVVRMDPRTGKVTGHAKLRLPKHYNAPVPVGWTADERLLLTIEPDDPDGPACYSVDPDTGRARSVKHLPGELDDVVLGSLS
jgi:hypothetical protein